MGQLNSGAAVVAFGGGPSRVVNQTFCSLVLHLQKSKAKRIYSPKFGLRGLLDEKNPQVFDLSKQPKDLLNKIAQQPGAISGTARRKLNEEKGEPEKLVELLKKNDVRYLYLIGGDDTASVCLQLQRAAQARNYELATFHLAKTIDNDLEGHHHTPGFPSAALFVAHAVQGIEADNRSTGGIQFVICMGKDAGYLSAAASLAKYKEDDGPHAFFLPEQKYSSLQHFLDSLVSKIEEIYSKLGRALVIVSEGIGITVSSNQSTKRVPLLKYILESKGESVVGDNFGGISLSRGTSLGDFLVNAVKSKIKADVRSTTLGYPQRSFPLIYSELDAQDAWLVGKEAVNYTLDGFEEGSVALLEPGAITKTTLLPLVMVGIRKREMPQEYLSPDGCLLNVPLFKEYAVPLIGKKVLPAPLVELVPAYYSFKT
ncbi:MAG: 6-phosphofructokinase [Candidatus Micrarchaeota archaeon]|nr:6-phosphofructokinase [Candidatus Micrarchaeota archaeon]